MILFKSFIEVVLMIVATFEYVRYWFALWLGMLENVKTYFLCSDYFDCFQLFYFPIKLRVWSIKIPNFGQYFEWIWLEDLLSVLYHYSQSIYLK